MPQPTEPTPPGNDSPLGPTPQINWQALIWYAGMMLLMLWLWQDFGARGTVRTIPYSDFKDYVKNKQVVECDVQDDAIVGLIRLSGKKETQPTVDKATDNQASVANDKKLAEQPVGTVPATKSETAPETKPESTPDAKQTPKLAISAEPATVKAAAAPKPSEFIFRTVRVDDPQLIADLEAANVKFEGIRPSFLYSLLTSWFIPFAIVFLIWTFLSRRLASAGSAMMSIGKSRAKLAGEESTGVSFDDVAGCDEAKYELEEVVDFLKHPEQYASLGAKIPKGVLLVGPPGTGKTLMARAVAGEAKVPFFSLSGSDFVEMFVGVGASRVRDLFKQAEATAPCIVFIDELDAIGRERGVHVGAVNDEREQTLNQLLVEMDGFEANVGVILLAATNRPEVLDKALLRPGRFDRQVIVDSPDIDGRVAILKVHARNKPLEEEVDLTRIAQATPGFSGADLANALNEAALMAARRKSKTITQHDLEEAVEKVVAGPERKSRRLNEHERERVAYHEVGHALVGTFSEHADPVHKISIVPRGRAALGYTLQLPTEEKFLMTRTELIERLRGLLGGRAAEEIVYGEISTGAENDLERATAMARQMVCMYGMSDQIGLLHCASRQPMYLQSGAGGLHTDCSDQTEQTIDQEVKQLLADAYEEAKHIITEHRAHLEAIARELLVKESLDSAAFKQWLEPVHA
ncbi:ATP-dependent zinc metalloprotease FtsH [Stieleria magnilauensis]